MTVFSLLTSSTTGIIVLCILVAVFLGVFIYDCKNYGFWKAVLKTIVSFAIIAVVYLVIYFVLSKVNAPFILVPLF